MAEEGAAPTVAALAGDSLAMDVSSAHHHGALLRYSVSLLGYGFYGDIVKDSEKKRWMGLIRYDFSGDRVPVGGPGAGAPERPSPGLVPELGPWDRGLSGCTEVGSARLGPRCPRLRGGLLPCARAWRGAPPAWAAVPGSVRCGRPLPEGSGRHCCPVFVPRAERGQHCRDEFGGRGGGRLGGAEGPGGPAPNVARSHADIRLQRRQRGSCHTGPRGPRTLAVPPGARGSPGRPPVGRVGR